jgi:hypothetical protein
MMKRAATSLTLALVWCLSLPAQQVTVTHNVNLRPTPSSAQPPIRLLLRPETVTLIDSGQTSGYYHVRTQQNESGWVWSHNVTVMAPEGGGAAPTDPPGPILPAAGTIASDNAACPAVGTHSVGGAPTPYADTSDAGLRNMAKRHVPTGPTPVTLDLVAFHALQDDVNSRFADAHTAKTQFHPDRQALINRPTSYGSVSEGELVQIAAYLTAVHREQAESVNCGGLDGADIHINIGTDNSTEWKGIVVEMIPQLGRPIGWDSASVARVMAARLQVLVVGGLTYDNEHLVNDDSAHPKGGQPKRQSLWEIHPITEFYVCEATSCDPAHHGQWTTLTTWAKAHAP